jgi:hypothetical protein
MLSPWYPFTMTIGIPGILDKLLDQENFTSLVNKACCIPMQPRFYNVAINRDGNEIMKRRSIIFSSVSSKQSIFPPLSTSQS